MRLSVSTLRRWARRAGYRWKRCRRSLRPQRDPAAFNACQAHLRALHETERRGKRAVGNVDECRFSRQAPVPYAWQRRGQPPVGRPAVRGSGGHSVLGFWQAHAPDQPLQAYVREGALTFSYGPSTTSLKRWTAPPCSCSTTPPSTRPGLPKG